MRERGPANHLQKLRDPARLAALATSELMDSPAEAAFDRVTRLTAKWLGVPVALLSLVDEQRQFFKSAIGLAEPWAARRETPLSHSFCQYGVTSGEPLIVSDAREHPWLSANLAIRDLGVIAYAGVPLLTSEQHVLGMLCAIDSTPRPWSEEEIGMLRELAALVATEMELRARVTALKVAEAAAEENRALLRSVLDCMEDSVVVTGKDGQVLLGNQTAKRVRPPAVVRLAAQGGQYGLFLPDGTTPLLPEDFPSVRALHGEIIQDLEIIRRMPGEPEQSYLVNASPVRDASGNIHAAVSVGRDNTKARLARGALSRSVALFRTVVRNLPNGAVILFDQNLRYMMADGERLLASIGLSNEALVGKTLQEVIPPERFEMMAARYRAALAGEAQHFEVVRDGLTFALNLVPVRDERDVITAGMALIYDVTEHKRTEASLRQQADEIRKLSIRDDLTGRPALLFFVDLNGMKMINDEYGHDEGDGALCETANVLRAAFRASDVVGRLGGDEFVALLPDANETQIDLFAARIERELAERNDRVGGYRLSASIGGCAYDPAQAESIEALLARADALMYEQKRNRPGSRRSPAPAAPPPSLTPAAK
jgi:diguanylate cyclase (GGDEF)-like protein/PAS domain S-box-containing protein